MNNIVFNIFISIIISTGLYAQTSEPDIAWAKRIGDNSPSSSQLFTIVTAVDEQDNSYIVGQRTGQTFTIDGITISSTGGSIGDMGIHGFIAKYDPNGQIIWAKSMLKIATGIHENFNSNKLIIDELGNIYLTGLYSYSKLHPSIINNYWLTDTTTQSNSQLTKDNMFLAKLDADGNVLWVQKAYHDFYNSNGLSYNTSEVFFDLEGNINMTGGFHSYITFTPGDTLTTDTDMAAVFLVTYSPTGEVLQSKKLAGETYPEDRFDKEMVRTDASGNLYRWSSRKGQNNPKRLYRYDAQGELLDSLTLDISTSGFYSPKFNGFAVSPNGDVFIGGLFFVDLTIEDSTYVGYGLDIKCDAILFKLSAPNYEIDWAKTYKSASSNSFDQVLTDALGNVYASGMKNSGAAQTIFHKYANNGDLLWEKILVAVTTSIQQSQNGGNIWAAGNFRGYASFAPGYDFTTPNSNHYNSFLVQYGLCNTANPTINIPTTTHLCGEGESITLSAHLNNLGSTYFWSTPNDTVAIGSSETTAELTVTQPGKYYLVAQEDAECYGKSQEIWVTQSLPDTNVTKQNNTLTATDITLGTTYQWIDCQNNNMAVSDATNQTFVPTQNGEYAVVLTSINGCTDTSNCHVINTLSIENNPDLDKQITIYPNPTSDKVTIKTSLEVDEITVMDLQGKKLNSSKSKEIDLSSLSSGVYLIKVRLSNSEIWTSKIIKE